MSISNNDHLRHAQEQQQFVQYCLEQDRKQKQRRREAPVVPTNFVDSEAAFRTAMEGLKSLFAKRPSVD